MSPPDADSADPSIRPAPQPEPETRSGYVTLAGAPNAGKSTLLNALVGEKLSIVTPKAQTTWQRVTGIRTEEDVQMIFLDTPGLLDVHSLFQRSMWGAAVEAVREADVVLLVLDATRSPSPERTEPIRRALAETSAPVLAAVNKIDEASESSVGAWTDWIGEEAGARVHPISALRRDGVEALEEDLRRTLPRGPFLYPPEDIAAAPVRFFVAEMIRETVFERFREEVPYSVFCQVDAFRENQEPLYIGANIYVERASQKGILIGKGGQAIRELGTAAREKIESFLGRSVYLDLWVKVLDGWRQKKGHLRRLGFRIPDDDEAPALS